MAASQDGGPYDDADDYSLIETSVGGNWSDLLAGYTPGRLFHPPDVATSDLDIVSQALFQTIPNYPRSIDLGIFVTPYFTRVEKTFAGVSIIPKVEHFAPRDVGFLSEPIDFSRVA